MILLDRPSPADTKQLPLGRHHLAKRTPAQQLLAGSHGSTVTGHLLSNVARYGQFHRERLTGWIVQACITVTRSHSRNRTCRPTFTKAMRRLSTQTRQRPAVGDQSSYPLALDQPENQIPQPGGHLRAPQPLGNTKSSPNCFKERCFKERCQALSPLPPLPVRPGPHLDHLGCSSSLSVYNWPPTNSGQGPATGFKHPT